jgi:hypothetical protein
VPRPQRRDDDAERDRRRRGGDDDVGQLDGVGAGAQPEVGVTGVRAEAPREDADQPGHDDRATGDEPRAQRHPDIDDVPDDDQFLVGW